MKGKKDKKNAGDKKKKKKKKAKKKEGPQNCDLCLFTTDSVDPIDNTAALKWGRPSGEGRECYYCRRLHRQDVPATCLSCANCLACSCEIGVEGVMIVSLFRCKHSLAPGGVQRDDSERGWRLREQA